MSRRLAREELFKIVFESEINGKDLDTVLASYLERENEVELNEKGKEFLVEYAKGISENQDKILAELDEKMEGWSFERVGNVEKALLKISVYEILFKDTQEYRFGYSLRILILNHFDTFCSMCHYQIGFAEEQMYQ